MQCIIEGCERKAKTRGLCSNCYQLARFKIKTGKVTWEQLESVGMALVSQHGAACKSAFQSKYNECFLEHNEEGEG